MDASWRDALGGDGLTDVGRPLTLRRGQPLHRADRTCRQFYVLLEVWWSLQVTLMSTHPRQRGMNPEEGSLQRVPICPTGVLQVRNCRGHFPTV